MKITDNSLWLAFHRVAQEKSFTRAAQTLRIGAPLLSKKIARLEEELGVRLFQRSTRRVSLTDEGTSLLPHVTAVLEDLRGLENRLENKDRPSGTVRITCLTGLAQRLFAPILAEFVNLNPAVRLEVDVSDRLVDLIETQTDVGIRIDLPEASDLIYRKLAPNEMIFCASPAYLKRHKTRIREPKDLQPHPVFMTDPVGDIGFRDGSFRFSEFRGSQRLRSESGIFLTEFAVQGAGVAIRPLWDAYPYLKSGKLVQLLPKHPLENFGDIYAVIPSRRFLARRVRAFLDFVVDEARRWEFLKYRP